MRNLAHYLRASTLATLLLVVQFQPVAATQLTPDEVISKWRAALHSPKLGPKLGTEVVTTSNEEGVSAENLEWITGSGQYHLVVNRPYDTSEYLLVGQIGTRRDWNKFVRTVRGRSLVRFSTDVAEEATLLFGPSPSSAASIIDSGSQSPVIIQIAVLGGDSITWYLDRATWRPLKSVRSGDDTQITTTLDDWREADGVLTPFHGRVTETNRPEYSWQRKSIRFRNDLGSKEFSALAPGPTDTYFTGPTQSIPFIFENDHIIFKIGLNKRESVLFLLDTGADQDVLNEGRVAQFGLETYGKTTTEGGGGTADYSYARGANFRLPGIELRNQHVAIIDESGLEKAYGMVIGGLLGFDFISRFVVEVDYEKLLITFHDPKTWQYTGAGYIVSVTIEDGIPFADATISVPTKPTIPARMILDFGAAETMTLTSPFVKANDLIQLAGTDPSVNHMAGLENQFFTQTNVRGRISRLTLGDLTVDSFPVNLSVNTTGAYASSSFSGTIGEGIYKRYHTFMDYTRDRIIFEPTADAAKPYPERRTYGLTFLASGDDFHTYTIVGVRSHSPAEEDGFLKGDIVTVLDSAPASKFTLGELRERLSHDSTHHDLKVLRNGGEFVKTIDIRKVSLDQK